MQRYVVCFPLDSSDMRGFMDRTVEVISDVTHRYVDADHAVGRALRCDGFAFAMARDDDAHWGCGFGYEACDVDTAQAFAADVAAAVQHVGVANTYRMVRAGGVQIV